MRSQLRFVMHPDDEAVLVGDVLQDPAVVFIDGPRWKTATPTTTRDIRAVGSYCIIWSSEDLQELAADFMPSANDWYCRSEDATIQFLRCSVTDATIREGRLAISTRAAGQQTAEKVERRYKLLCRTIKKTYLNSVVRWRTPGEPDRSLWVGPAAMTWLIDNPARRVLPIAGTVEGTVGPVGKQGD